ncbi:MAG: hypothetical protein M5U14_01520 [Acidimicrobiia bacterium]|nr:hypothetical protein [Acidimicrobiia bacterium]
MSFLSWVVVGFVAGVLAKGVTGVRGIGCLGTIVVGVLGALLGGSSSRPPAARGSTTSASARSSWRSSARRCCSSPTTWRWGVAPAAVEPGWGTGRQTWAAGVPVSRSAPVPRCVARPRRTAPVPRPCGGADLPPILPEWRWGRYPG